ncbi:hypothetical protein ACFLSQ_00400 [Bacteroidota bacterium]
MIRIIKQILFKINIKVLSKLIIPTFILIACSTQIINEYSKLKKENIENHFDIQKNKTDDTVTYLHINFAGNHIRYWKYWSGRVLSMEVKKSQEELELELIIRLKAARPKYFEIKVGEEKHKIQLKKNSIIIKKQRIGKGVFCWLHIHLTANKILETLRKIDNFKINVSIRLFGPEPKDSVIFKPKSGRRIKDKRRIEVKQYISDPYILTLEDKIGLMQTVELYDMLLKKSLNK